jgi:hypothetical protein
MVMEQLLVAPGLPHPLPGEENLAQLIDAFPGCKLVQIYGGYRVKTTEWCHVDVLFQIFNWRITETELGDMPYPGYRRGWCYDKLSSGLFVATIKACMWDGRPDTEPSGWVRAIDPAEVRCRPDYKERRDGRPREGITQV